MNGPDGRPAIKSRRRRNKNPKKSQPSKAEASVKAQKTQHEVSGELATPERPAYRVQIAFDGRPHGQSSFDENEVILVIHKGEDEWWLCQRLDGTAQGYIPSSYLEQRTAAAGKFSPSPTPRPSSSVYSFNGAWQEHCHEMAKHIPVMRPTTGWPYANMSYGTAQEDGTSRRAVTPQARTPPELDLRSTQDRMADALRRFHLRELDNDATDVDPKDASPKDSEFRSMFLHPSPPNVPLNKPDKNVPIGNPPAGTRSAGQAFTPPSSVDFRFSMIRRPREPDEPAAPSLGLQGDQVPATGDKPNIAATTNTLFSMQANPVPATGGKRKPVAHMTRGTAEEKEDAGFPSKTEYCGPSTKSENAVFPKTTSSMSYSMGYGYAPLTTRLPEHCPMPLDLSEIRKIFNDNRSRLPGCPKGLGHAPANYAPNDLSPQARYVQDNVQGRNILPAVPVHPRNPRFKQNSRDGRAPDIEPTSATTPPIAQYHPSYPGPPAYTPQQPQSTAADGASKTWASMFNKPMRAGQEQEAPAIAAKGKAEVEAEASSAPRMRRPKNRLPPPPMGGLVEPVLRPKSPVRKKETGGRGPKWNGRK